MLFERLAGLTPAQIHFLIAGMLLQGAVFTVLPEEVIITTLGALWGNGQIGFWESLLTVQIGLLPANVILFAAGRHLGAPLLARPPFRWLVNGSRVETAAGRVRAYGTWVVALTRFTPLVRGPIYFACGTARMPILKFVASDGIASLVHIPLLLYIGRQIAHLPH